MDWLRKQLESPDFSHGEYVKIDKILHIEADEDYGYSIEFIDDEGKYRNWKQYFDGGYALFR